MAMRQQSSGEPMSSGGDELRASRPKFRASVRRDGSVTIPAWVRELMKLGGGSEVEFELTLAGLTLRPVHEGRDPEQWWFWTEPWQQAEQQPSDGSALAEGRGRYMTGDELLARLDALDGENPPKA